MMRTPSDAQPVLAYATGLPEIPGEVAWRDEPLGEGGEFFVSPPPLLRLIIGPAMLVLVATPFFALGILILGGVVRHADKLLRPSAIAASLIPVGLGAVLILAWANAVRRLYRAARHGRTPFRMRVSGRGFRIASAPCADNDPGGDPCADEDDARPVAGVWLNETSPGPFYRVVFLFIKFDHDDRSPRNIGVNEPRGVYIAWPNRHPLVDWELALRDALIRRRSPEAARPTQGGSTANVRTE